MSFETVYSIAHILDDIGQLIVANSSPSDALNDFTVCCGVFQEFKVVMVWDSQAKGHKYVCLHGAMQSFLIALPLSLIELHKQILALARDATCDDSIYCEAGGYLKIEAEQLIAYGASQDYGAYDHDFAEKAFNSIC